MKDEVFATPAVLRWARETAGLEVDDVVARLNRKRITAEVISAWESGADTPSYLQLERLAYEVYRRPLALFFFPEPPHEQTPSQAFRTLPEEETSRLPTRIRLLVRQAQAMQLNLLELFDGANPAKRRIINDRSFEVHMSARDMASWVRDYLGWPLRRQQEWSSDEDAMKAWREILEDHGVFVFKDAFRVGEFSGFCLYDEVFPIIYVNNSKPCTRQIFTLFHELAHLLFHTGGVDVLEDDFVSRLQGDQKQVEVLCNRFAAEFLLPTDDFRLQITGEILDDHAIEGWARLYHVSREVILRRLLELRRVDRSYYEERVREWRLDRTERKRSGGDYYRTRATYLGNTYIEAAFSKFYRNRISTEQLAGYLGVKARHVPRMEGVLLARGASA